MTKEGGQSANPTVDYRKLMRRKTVRRIPVDRGLKHLAALIDTSFDARQRDGLLRALKLGDELQKRRLKPTQTVVLHYFLGNAWSNLRWIEKKGTAESWNWEQHEIEQEITNFRLALNNPEFKNCDDYRRCQILTNLGNLMNHVGRFVEAQGYLKRALSILPNFGMGLGSRGTTLSDYARSIPRRHDAILMLEESERMLSDALRSQMIHNAAREHYAERLNLIQAAQEKNRQRQDRFKLNKTFGKSKKERSYRQWCLQERLFLNYLNDITAEQCAAEDNVILPSLTRKIGEGLHFEGLYNQLKQEFVSARFLYFEATNRTSVHFSDKGVVLYDTMDCPSHSLAVEKVKTAYRVAYSVFDKIAFFLNAYFELGIDERQVTFRTFWYTDRQKKRGLRTEFTQRKNWPMRGLFWLSKDLFEDAAGFRAAIEPEAQELKRIRDHIEHKYLKVLEFGYPPFTWESFRDQLALTVSRQDLYRKTLSVLKMARAALIYLSVAVYWEERARNAKRADEKTVELTLQILKEERKV